MGYKGRLHPTLLLPRRALLQKDVVGTPLLRTYCVSSQCTPSLSLCTTYSDALRSVRTFAFYKTPLSLTYTNPSDSLTPMRSHPIFIRYALFLVMALMKLKQT